MGSMYGVFAIKFNQMWVKYTIHGSYGKEKKSSPGTSAQVPAVGKFSGQGLGEVLGFRNSKIICFCKKALQYYEKPSIIYKSSMNHL